MRVVQRYGIGWAAIVALLLLPSPSAGQWTDDPPPADSPYWWTLTDDITPEQLRDTLQDREAHVERYYQAVEKEPTYRLPEHLVAHLTIYVKGDLTPELFPLIDTFDAFALRFRGRPSWPKHAPEELEEWGISRPGVQTILALAHSHLRRRDQIIDEVKDKQQAFVKILQRADDRLGRKASVAARRARDVEVFARVSGLGRARVAELMEAWLRDPAEEAAIEHIQLVRQELSEKDWELFRSYLYRDVAVLMSIVDYDEEAFQ